jgi:hypothetical protein
VVSDAERLIRVVDDDDGLRALGKAKDAQLWRHVVAVACVLDRDDPAVIEAGELIPNDGATVESNPPLRSWWSWQG